MGLLTAESIERFIEDQAFLRSYVSAPSPPPPVSGSTGDLQEDWEREKTYWLGGGGGEGGGPNHKQARKHGPL